MTNIPRIGIVAAVIGLSVLFGWRKPIVAEVPRLTEHTCGKVAEPKSQSPDAMAQSPALGMGAEGATEGGSPTCGLLMNVNIVRVDFIILADYSSFHTTGGAYDRAVQMFKISQASFMSANFNKPATLRLHRIYQFVDSDPISTSTDPATLLTSIRDWKMANAADNNIALVALTARDMDSSSVELGFVGSLCSSNNVGFISESAGSNIPYAAALTSHVIGHLGGMQHDSVGGPCPPTGSIMSPSINPASPPNSFSPCSITYWNAFMPGINCTHQFGTEVGDLDCNCMVDELEIETLVHTLIFGEPPGSCPFTQCDLNSDGSVDGNDIHCFKSVFLAQPF